MGFLWTAFVLLAAVVGLILLGYIAMSFMVATIISITMNGLR